MVFLSLTKSGNGVLLHFDGGVAVTSVKYLQMLLDGKLNGGMLHCRLLTDARSSLGNVQEKVKDSVVDFGDFAK